MRRVAMASFVGTTIEYYDLFIFALATALVFGNVFFSSLGGGRGTLALGATYAVAFVARPLGAVLFGHIGDRVGRKQTLIYTLLLMGCSTFAIGLIPSYDSIGVTAPLILVGLRFLQGIAVGGEWAGAALLMAEYAPPRRRGQYGMAPQLGIGMAFALSSGTFLAVFSLTGDPINDPAFQDWGWRIPFLASSVLVGIGLYVRLTIAETPIFLRSRAQAAPARVPVRNALSMRWRQILLVSGALASTYAFFYIGAVFLAGYAGRNPRGVPPGVLGLSTPTILSLSLLSVLAFLVACVLAAVLSDRWGRRAVILAGNGLGIPVGLVVFPILDTGGSLALGFALCLLTTVVGITMGPAAAFVPELFDTRYRYTGAGLAYNLAGILGGALPILIAPAILDTFNSSAVGVYLAVVALVGVCCAGLLPETRNVDIAAVGSSA